MRFPSVSHPPSISVSHIHTPSPHTRTHTRSVREHAHARASLHTFGRDQGDARMEGGLDRRVGGKEQGGRDRRCKGGLEHGNAMLMVTGGDHRIHLLSCVCAGAVRVGLSGDSDRVFCVMQGRGDSFSFTAALCGDRIHQKPWPCRRLAVHKRLLWNPPSFDAYAV